MGNDWEGLWIGSGRQLPQSDEEFYEDDPAPLLRRSFEVSRPVRRARPICDSTRLPRSSPETGCLFQTPCLILRGLQRATESTTECTMLQKGW